MSTRRALPLLLAVVALLLAGVSLPHIHASTTQGLWNADHDLTLMAVFGTHACQLDAVPVIGVEVALAATIALALTPVAAAPPRLADSRAPPRF